MLLFGFLLLVCVSRLGAQRIREIEFKNQAITDILLVLAEMAGKSIVPDETVSGNASYYFTEAEFDTALRIFLSTYRMYFWTEEGITYVSRVRASYDKVTDTVSLDAEDVEVRFIVRTLSRTIGKTILFDTLPKENLTVHVAGTRPETVLEILTRRFPDYRVESTAQFHYIRRLDAAAKVEPKAEAPLPLVSVKEDRYSVAVDKARLRDVLNELFQKRGVEFSVLLRADSMVENLRFSGKQFDEILGLVLEQANADFAVEGGIYYIFEIQRTDVVKKLKTMVQLPLTYVPVQELPNLLPAELASQNLYRLDKSTNSVILNGSQAEIAPLEEFIRKLDQPLGGRSYHRFDLGFLKVSEIVALLPPQLAGQRPITVPQANAFVMLLSPENKKAVDDLLLAADRKQEGLPVRLRFIQADYLLKYLPPSAAKEDIQLTGDTSIVFFTGTAEKRAQFLRELAVLDHPVPQVRYELLVIQYQGGRAANWSINLDSGLIPPAGAVNAFLGSIGKLLSLSFDIVSTFGFLFAVDLNLDISTNTANVLADTTLNGLSGQEIKFQNTSTYRYRDVEIDPDTGKATNTGVTREIASGLIISMNGWVSGDGLITMNVSATVSKRGADVSSTTGNPPPTSEKVVSTNVRTESGKPVVIGGLIQQEKVKVEQKVPLLGDIPLLGYLFRSSRDSVENTEMVIYIVPHVEYPSRRTADVGRKLEELYTKLAKGL